jgi:tRNA threonylcarbamoyladenosine biosynthesis protein TsaB
MIVLGFDTATCATSVGLLLADGSALQARDDPAPDEHPGHATRLLTMAAELLAQAGIAWPDLDRIAVGLGPGRFTGLRVGVATARGLAQSRSLQLAGVSTLRALAESAARVSEGGHERILSVIDARRGEVFAGAYTRASCAPLPRADLRGALAPEQLEVVVAQALADDGERWLAVGDGTARVRAQLQRAGAEVPEDSSPLHLVDARVLCELGERAAAAASYEDVRPDYRRPPDAEQARASRAARRPATALEVVPR